MHADNNIKTNCSQSVKLRLNDKNGQKDKRTQTLGIEFGAFRLKMWNLFCNNFNDFPDNQLTKFRIYCWSWIFNLLNFYETSRSIWWMPLTDTKDKRTNGRVRLSVWSFKWSLTQKLDCSNEHPYFTKHGSIIYMKNRKRLN